MQSYTLSFNNPNVHTIPWDLVIQHYVIQPDNREAHKLKLGKQPYRRPCQRDSTQIISMLKFHKGYIFKLSLQQG